jgi:hypothetical protein
MLNTNFGKGEIPMKTFNKFVMFALTMSLLAACALAQDEQAAPAGTPEVVPPVAALANIVEGQGTIVSQSNPAWDGMSEMVLIPGAALMGSATSTGLYLGFSGGSTVDIDNMVLYTTPRGGSTITATKKLTLNKVADPSITLTSKTVCPTQPVSATNPCFIKLDVVKGALSPLNDYYFVVYFTLDTNNEAITGVGSTNEQGSLTGWYLFGDQTRIGKGGALPVGNAGAGPFFLSFVVNQ